MRILSVSGKFTTEKASSKEVQDNRERIHKIEIIYINWKSYLLYLGEKKILFLIHDIAPEFFYTFMLNSTFIYGKLSTFLLGYKVSHLMGL